MKYERDIIVSTLCETSKSRNEVPLISAREGNYEVYDLDKLKDAFCREYRNDEKLKSCDAFYCDEHNRVAIEFKNTHHRNLKQYYREIEIKIVDTHMLLAETFFENKKNTELTKKLELLVVYNDALNYGNGICQFISDLNEVKPKKGDDTRKVTSPKFFADDTEFSKAVAETREKYEGLFYRKIRFIEKKDFRTDYLETGYFNNLSQ